MYLIVYWLYKISRFLYLCKIPILPLLIKYFIRIVFSAVVPYNCKIGKGTRIGYGGLGTVFHSNCTVGENCIIHSGVTIGAKSSINNLAPKIGNNVLIGTGAKILGSIVIGNNVVIGANSVVTKDVPDNALVTGIPARTIKENINIKDYI